jgi:hypothetical protein
MRGYNSLKTNNAPAPTTAEKREDWWEISAAITGAL